MPFGFGEGNSDEAKLKQESARTQRQGNEDDNPADDGEEARLGQDLLRTSAAADGAARPKILLCVSGSVAVVKVPQLAVKLAEFAEVIRRGAPAVLFPAPSEPT